MSEPAEIGIRMNNGQEARLADWAGHVVLVVNVASKCGLTPQYEGLEALHRAKKDQGLVILGVPANDFKQQEPGTDAEILDFCQTRFDISFPLAARTSVVGADKHALYAHLIAEAPAAEGDGPWRTRLEGFGIPVNPAPEVQWNFEKFLIGRDGSVVGRFAPDVAADDPRLVAAIDRALAKPA
ncbi:MULTISPECIES: glutathione peroxidase [unclassified Paracoccus (in: a-proteobacteria)]|uniref:glutathione peroxidase n=1 Tax=unclassified Paracoccus (in: a-proteobacteria) TaxID=2688777 RepID=UPI0015FEBDCA|nr:MULTISPECIES: glutathione peroxidase [unclassified Paracoccus (in: a-proteobacteria)]MBB1490836.1 glutathione peroxidase [Paracoccus sp. MC1854]MBB1497820.1 glutathione peroxidase [Paracoccus sp. MC1862]